MTSPNQRDAPSSPKIERSPDARTVLDFHRNDDVNSRPEAHHHTLGKSSNEASPGAHVHDGQTSPSLLSASITGSRTNNVASILDQILDELEKIGIVNATSA